MAKAITTYFAHLVLANGKKTVTIAGARDAYHAFRLGDVEAEKLGGGFTRDVKKLTRIELKKQHS